ncbi:MAG: DUF1858 domain-containing protein, partial [Desulfobacula sp.]|nr:DUF1858 domain-containing protein [Desulfobacula sp.]
KVLQLIEAYPKLEDVLIEYAPAFKKLKNPVLRKTVAKIATLQQAAAVGNVKVEDLINHLRKEVGQNLYSGTSSTEYTTQKPDWFNEALIELKFNAKKMLATGEQPAHQIIADLDTMGKDKIYKLIAPFLPAPLIDKATSLKIRHWVEKINDEEFNVYFYKGEKNEYTR